MKKQAKKARENAIVRVIEQFAKLYHEHEMLKREAALMRELLKK